MENKQVSYIKTDDNKIINEKCIRWVQKMSNCLEVCVRTNGCRSRINTHTICKTNNPESYNKLNQFFD
jgi:hypothetical protein